jgi:hypothetical protein
LFYNQKLMELMNIKTDKSWNFSQNNSPCLLHDLRFIQLHSGTCSAIHYKMNNSIWSGFMQLDMQPPYLLRPGI